MASANDIIGLLCATPSKQEYGVPACRSAGAWNDCDDQNSQDRKPANTAKGYALSMLAFHLAQIALMLPFRPAGRKVRLYLNWRGTSVPLSWVLPNLVSPAEGAEPRELNLAVAGHIA